MSVEIRVLTSNEPHERYSAQVASADPTWIGFGATPLEAVCALAERQATVAAYASAHDLDPVTLAQE